MRKFLLSGVAIACLFQPDIAHAQSEEVGIWDTIIGVFSELLGNDDDGQPESSDGETETPTTAEGKAKSSPLLFVRPVIVEFEQAVFNFEEGAGRIEIPLVLSAVPERDIEVIYTIEPGTARSPEDYVDSANGSIKIKAGQQTGVIVQSLPDDGEYEGETPENYYIELQSARGGGLGQTLRTEVRIKDTAPKPMASVAPGRLAAVPAQVEFGRVDVDQAYDVDINIRHAGDTDVQIGRLEETADRVEIQSQTCQNVILSSGGVCTVRVRFSPDADGVYEGTLIVQGSTEANGSSVPIVLRIPLRGEGYLKPADLDPQRVIREKMQLRRRLGNGVTISTVSRPVSPSPREYITSQDYDEAVAPGNTHVTLPMDLERILTTFQSIPCVLENSINSQHPGQAVCVVEQNIYSYHGFKHRFVLIPGGSKFQGSYTPLAKNGDTRLSIAWQRMLKPDGSMLWLPDGFPTQDAMGRTSMPGQIDDREWEQFGTPILLTALTALATEAVSQGEEGLSGSEQVLLDGESRVITQMLSKNLDLQRIMTITASSRLTIKPTVDILFEPTGIRVLGKAAAAQQVSSSQTNGGSRQSSDEKGSSSEPPSLAAQPTVH